jgi:hypothetical protein
MKVGRHRKNLPSIGCRISVEETQQEQDFLKFGREHDLYRLIDSQTILIV